MTLPEAATERVLRECGCPPWVVRCAHLGDPSDHLVHLADRDIFGPMSSCPADLLPDVRYHVCVWDDQREIGAWGTLDGPEHRIKPYRSDSYDAALAAFHAAEMELLRGGE